MKFGLLFRRARKKLKLTQQQVADRIPGGSQANVCRLETIPQDPYWTTCRIMIEKGLGLTVREFLEMLEYED